MTTCTNHCGACGRHFHSLEAFDLHRVGDHASSDPEKGRRCVDPLDLEDRDGKARLVALATDGECRMYDDGSKTNIKYGATIWTKAGYDQVRHAFAKASESLAEAG